MFQVWVPLYATLVGSNCGSLSLAFRIADFDLQAGLHYDSVSYWYCGAAYYNWVAKFER